MISIFTPGFSAAYSSAALLAQASSAASTSPSGSAPAVGGASAASPQPESAISAVRPNAGMIFFRFRMVLSRPFRKLFPAMLEYRYRLFVPRLYHGMGAA